VRSGSEISAALRAICAAAETLSASLPPDDSMFLSRLLHVDPEAGSIVVAWSTAKDANLAILAAERVAFACSHEGAHYEFLAAEPQETDHGGEPGIRFAFPESLLVLHRRAYRRYAVPPQVPLSCEISLGAIAFDAKIVDISLNGIGAIIYDAGIRLEPGMLLRRTRIIQPGGRPVVVDLEVRYISRIVLPDGRAAHRAGCRFIGTVGEIESLIRFFITELHRREAPSPPRGDRR
jgi:c-di-GMP-binding flagellar brake protein YcgR